jgi:hypothetical protein
MIVMVWLALFFLLGFGAWNFQAGQLMLIIYLIVSFLAYGSYAFYARCPHCAMPVLLKPVKLFGMEIFMWSIITPERCRHCGEPL